MNIVIPYKSTQNIIISGSDWLGDEKALWYAYVNLSLDNTRSEEPKLCGINGTWGALTIGYPSYNEDWLLEVWRAFEANDLEALTMLKMKGGTYER